MKCPNCGAEMKTCCQLVAEAQQKAGIIYQHSCGPSEWVCERCGHRQYVTGFIPGTLSDLRVSELKKKEMELSEERRKYKDGSPWEIYLGGIIQGIHYTMGYPFATYSWRADIEGKSHDQDKIEEPCEHHYVPMEINFNQVDAVSCPKCGDVQRRYNFVREANPKFPWATFHLLQSETK